MNYEVERVFQQGDIIFIKVKEDSLDEKELNKLQKKGRSADGRFIVAEGEATGHHHAIKEEVDMRIVDEDLNQFVIVADEAFALGHEEHSFKNRVKKAGSVEALNKAEVEYIEEVLEEDPSQDFDALVEKLPHELKMPEGTYVTRKVREFDNEQQRSRWVRD